MPWTEHISLQEFEAMHGLSITAVAQVPTSLPHAKSKPKTKSQDSKSTKKKNKKTKAKKTEPQEIVELSD